MNKETRLNWNTVILTVGFSVMGYLSSDLYSEIRKTHDAVLVLQVQVGQFIPKADFDVQLMDVRSKLTSIESRQSATEIELQKIRDKRTN